MKTGPAVLLKLWIASWQLATTVDRVLATRFLTDYEGTEGSTKYFQC